MRKLAILLGSLLVAGIVVQLIPFAHAASPPQCPLVSSVCPPQTVNSLKITDPNDPARGQMFNGGIVHLELHPGESKTIALGIETPAPNMNVIIAEQDLPGGTVMFNDPVHPTKKTFYWDISYDDDFYPVRLPATYSVTFQVPGIPILTKYVLIAIETETPQIEVAFDKMGYQAGDPARIKIVDPRANLNDFAEQIQAELRMKNGPNIISTEQQTFDESPEDPGVFYLTYNVPSGGDTIEASYKGHTAAANVGLSIKFSDTQYYLTDGVIPFEIKDPSKRNNGATDSIGVTVTSTSNMAGTSISVTESPPDSGVFQGTISIGGSPTIAVHVGDTITASYFASPDKQVAAKADIISQEFRFKREVYTNYDSASLVVVDKAWNHDKYARDTIPVTVRSSDTNPNFSNRHITNTLIESGVDTGKFYSYETVLVTNNQDIANTNDHALFARDGDTLSASYSASVHSASATVSISAMAPGVPTFLSGFNEDGGGTPTTAAIIFPNIVQITCDAYGDSDSDGLCNNFDNGGSPRVPYRGTTQSFSDMCNPCPTSSQRDIYLEADYDTSIYPAPDYTLKLRQALDNVKTAFANAPSGGITLHYKINDPITVPGDGTVNIWSDSGGSDGINDNSYTDIKSNHLGVSGEVQYKKEVRNQLWHYLEVIKKQNYAPTSSGLAEVVGNDMIMSIAGNFPNNSVNLQTGTIMHELGHNLGLQHGGGISIPVSSLTPGPPSGYPWEADAYIKCQPNDVSVMNYMFQSLSAWNYPQMKADYPRGNLSPDLDYTNLSESQGITPPISMNITSGVPNPNYNPSAPPFDPNQPISDSNPLPYLTRPRITTISPGAHSINWNNNANPSESGVNFHITDTGVLGCDWSRNPIGTNPDGTTIKLKDYDGWGHLILDFKKYNVASISTGSPIMSPGAYNDTERDIKLLAIQHLDDLIQKLPDSDFVQNPQGVRQALHDDLLNRVPQGGTHVTIGPGNYDVATLILFDKPGPPGNDIFDLKYALTRLEDIRTLMDGTAGGDPNNDQLTPKGQAEVLPFLDANIAAMATELDMPYTNGIHKFTATYCLYDSGHQRCGADYKIVGSSDSITNAVDTFSYDNVTGNIRLQLIGGVTRSLELTVPKALLPIINDTFGFGYDQGTPKVIFNNSTHYTILLKNLPMNPGVLTLSGVPHPPIPVIVTPPEPEDVNGSVLSTVTSGQQIVLSTTVTNNNNSAQPYVALIEVRDSDGVTVYLAWSTGTLGPNGQTNVGLSWTPPEPGTYTLRTFVISNLANPTILSPVATSNITVN